MGLVAPSSGAWDGAPGPMVALGALGCTRFQSSALQGNDTDSDDFFLSATAGVWGRRRLSSRPFQCPIIG